MILFCLNTRLSIGQLTFGEENTIISVCLYRKCLDRWTLFNRLKRSFILKLDRRKCFICLFVCLASHGSDGNTHLISRLLIIDQINMWLYFRLRQRQNKSLFCYDNRLSKYYAYTQLPANNHLNRSMDTPKNTTDAHKTEQIIEEFTECTIMIVVKSSLIHLFQDHFLLLLRFST